MPNKLLPYMVLMHNHCNVILKIHFVQYKNCSELSTDKIGQFYVMATVADIFKSRQRKKDVTVRILPS